MLPLALLPLLWVLLLADAPRALAQQPARHVSEQAVYEVAADLRCVVCQNLSVADSPSEMATQMRAIVRERLAAGDSPAQVRQYFVERYGEWILLAPRREGFNLLVWIAPGVAVAVGLLVVGVRVRGWARRRRAAGPAAVDPAMRERIRRALEDDA
jgi:cytochrome c-type biogenesis protein CcmH